MLVVTHIIQKFVEHIGRLLSARLEFSFCGIIELSVKKKKIKVALLKICLLVHNMGIVSLSETYLESSVPTDDDIFRIRGYSSVMTIRQAKREVQF